MDIDRHHACLAMPVSLIYRDFGVVIANRMARTPVDLTHWVAIRISLRRGPGRTRELVDADLPRRISESFCCHSMLSQNTDEDGHGATVYPVRSSVYFELTIYQLPQRDMEIGYCLTHLQDSRRAVQSCYVFERSRTHDQGRKREDCHWTYIYSPKHFSLG